jgi:hypothetical protein
MKAIKFEGEINNTSVKTLLNDIDKIDSNENIVLYMSSSGGTCTDTNDLYDYINRFENRFEIVCNWEMSSAAFDLLLNVNCKILLNKDAFAIIHLFNNKLDYFELKDKNSVSIHLFRNLEMKNNEFISDLIRCGFSDYDIARIKLGNDVIIKSDKMKSMIQILNPKAKLL